MSYLVPCGNRGSHTSERGPPFLPCSWSLTFWGFWDGLGYVESESLHPWPPCTKEKIRWNLVHASMLTERNQRNETVIKGIETV